MALARTQSLNPRKKPVQARSAVTLDAIYDAAIQVLLAVGPKRTTTIRVAARAGVSVGTLYQYHANIQSLMASVIERHVSGVTDAVERACKASRGQKLEIMLRAFIDAFIQAKTARVDVSKALYTVFFDLNCQDTLRRATDRNTKAVEAMLGTATDFKIKNTGKVAEIMVAALSGPIRNLIERNASGRVIQNTRQHLLLLCLGYIKETEGRSGDRKGFERQ